MSEPDGPAPDDASQLPPAPFEPGAPRNPAGSGCAKVALVGCLGLLIVLGIGLIVMVTQGPKLFGTLLGYAQTELEARYAPDVTDADRARLRAAFASARQAVAERRMDPVAMQTLQRRLMDTLWSQGPISRDQALALAEALEAVGASKAPAGPPG
jgi:hypothetical protein